MIKKIEGPWISDCLVLQQQQYECNTRAHTPARLSAASSCSWQQQLLNRHSTIIRSQLMSIMIWISICLHSLVAWIIWRFLSKGFHVYIEHACWKIPLQYIVTEHTDMAMHIEFVWCKNLDRFALHFQIVTHKGVYITQTLDFHTVKHTKILNWNIYWMYASVTPPWHTQHTPEN